MKRIVVTGANKGIGLAIVEAILAEHADTFVYLGSRDAARGEAAVAGLAAAHPAWRERLAVLAIDVGDDASVTSAAQHVAATAGEPLYGVVNNAGVGQGSLPVLLGTNTLGVRRVTEAFAPLLQDPGGRIVNVTSASGPLFVAGCSPERQRFFLDPNATWTALEAVIGECLALEGDPAGFAAAGLSDGSGYGLSKACANTYTMIAAREHPGLVVNACTPGFIETDLTRHYLSDGKTAQDSGMKSPAEGARSTMALLFGDVEGRGWFYGSDAVRSPLDRYRSPGSPAFTG